MGSLAPAQLFHQHLHNVLSQLPAVFDGDSEAVHEARIATRRLREVLPLLDGEQIDHVTEAVKTAGRELGCVRELDVMSEMLESMSEHIPVAGAVELHTLRRLVRVRRANARREMVKKLESLDLPALRAAGNAGLSSRLWRQVSRAVPLRTPPWVEPIWNHITQRTADVVTAAERAPGVYLPNRTHRARVAVKKLRYAVEVAAETGVWNAPRVLRELRKIQGVLGKLHDAQVLADLADSAPSPDPPAPNSGTVAELLATEIARQHAEYMRRRPRLFLIAGACTRAAASRTRWHVPRAIVAATVFTAPLVVLESVRTARTR